MIAIKFYIELFNNRVLKVKSNRGIWLAEGYDVGLQRNRSRVRILMGQK